MITTIEEFEHIFKQEVEGTQKQMDALTDESLSQSVAKDHRTLARVAWHIITTYPEMMSRTGLKFTSVTEKTPLPTASDEFRKEYAKTAKQLLEQVKANWDDAALQVEDDLYGQKWKRGMTLEILIKHEVHHRGQRTVLMRQAGIKVPGIYGPSKEEWVNYKMQEPEL